MPLSKVSLKSVLDQVLPNIRWSRMKQSSFVSEIYTGDNADLLSGDAKAKIMALNTQIDE